MQCCENESDDVSTRVIFRGINETNYRILPSPLASTRFIYRGGKNDMSILIGHFRVPFASISKRVYVRNLSYENEFYSQVHSNANQTYFHMKGFTLGLVLKQRQKATQKWPIKISNW